MMSLSSDMMYSHLASPFAEDEIPYFAACTLELELVRHAFFSASPSRAKSEPKAIEIVAHDQSETSSFFKMFV
jgi:hypothetical protein